MKEIQPPTDDLRIREIRELSPPSHVLREFPVTDHAAKVTSETRAAIQTVMTSARFRNSRVTKMSEQLRCVATSSIGAASASAAPPTAYSSGFP